MSFDVENPPAEPPDECQNRLLWRLARSLWEAHRPDSAGFCVIAGCWQENQRDPCPLAQLAQEGMRTACGETTAAPPPVPPGTGQRIQAAEQEAANRRLLARARTMMQPHSRASRPDGSTR